MFETSHRKSMTRVCGFLLLTAAAWIVAVSLAAAGDPTRPPSYAPAPERAVKAVDLKPLESLSLSLNSVFFSAERRAAVINGKMLTVGQSIDNAKLVDIQPYGVTLKYGSQKIHLRLSENAVVSPAGERKDQKRMK